MFILSIDALGITTPDYYFYLNQSGCYDVEGTDDKQDFRDTLVSANVLNSMTSFVYAYYLLLESYDSGWLVRRDTECCV